MEYFYGKFAKYKNTKLRFNTLRFVAIFAVIGFGGSLGSAVATAQNNHTHDTSHSHDAANSARLSQNELMADTVKLLNLQNNFKNGSADEKNNLNKAIISFAEVRKVKFQEAIKNNSQAAIQAAVPTEIYTQLPFEAQQYVEQQVEIKGTFVHLHSDDMEKGISKHTHYVNEEGTNKRFRVYFTHDDVPAKTGDKIVINGVKLGNNMAANNADVDIAETAVATATSSRKVAVIMFNWQNDTRTTFTQDTARGAYFTDSNSANAFFKENSYGKTELVGKLRTDGDVFGWYTIPRNNNNCDFYFDFGWQQDADAAAVASGVDLSGYDHISYIFPPLGDCGWGGKAELNGQRSWINSTEKSVITHEIGHNIGSHHASSISCTDGSGVRVTISDSCTFSEYGDPFSVMGYDPEYKHFNDHQKGLVGWFDQATNTHTINRTTAPDSSYMVAPTEQASSGVQSLRVPIGNYTDPLQDDYYYIEFRQPFGFDNFSPTSPVVNGVTLRSARNYTSPTQSKLLDTTPATNSFYDASLQVGKTFSDTAKGINITLLSVSPSGANVQVWFTPASCVRANPTLTLTPTSTTLMVGQSGSFNYTIKNNDTRQCPNSTFNIAPNLPGGFSQSPTSISHSLRPGASANGSFIVSSSAAVTPGVYTIPETATNLSATVIKTTSNLSIAINSNTDTAPPVITISSPLDGAKITKTLKITASATDQTAVAEIKLLLDGVVLKTCVNVTTCSHSVAGSTLTPGAHIVTVEAKDTLGFSSSKSVNITR